MHIRNGYFETRYWLCNYYKIDLEFIYNYFEGSVK